MSGGSQKNSSWLRSFRCQAPFIHIPGYPWSIHHFLGAARIPLTRNIFVENGTLLLPQEESTHLRKWPRSIREMWNTQCRILELKKLACRKIANWWLVTILKAAFGAQFWAHFSTRSPLDLCHLCWIWDFLCCKLNLTRNSCFEQVVPAPIHF